MANGKPSPEGFNVAEKVDDRARRPITIGPKTYFPVRETTETRAENRKLIREINGCTAELREIGEKADKRSLDRADAIEVEMEELLYKQVALALVDEQGTRPEAAFIAEHLPTGMIGPLFEFLNKDVTENPS